MECAGKLNSKRSGPKITPEGQFTAYYKISTGLSNVETCPLFSNYQQKHLTDNSRSPFPVSDDGKGRNGGGRRRRSIHV